MGIRELNIQLSYAGKGEQILRNFLIPVINEAVLYDRITSFYTIESLLAISQGIESIYQKHGKMRLIIGVHSLPREFVDASLRREYLRDQVAKVRKEIKDGIASLSDELKRKQIATIAWMIEDNLLEIKTAAVKDSGIFHPKTLILSDEKDTIAAVGSPNETGSGLGGNFEQIMVAASWRAPDEVAVQKNFFDSLWDNEHIDAEVIDITKETISIIIEALGREYIDLQRNITRINGGDGIISNSAKMLANYFVSGDIPALYMHQERAVIDALSRWPVRVLFSDEVGLGKTFEVAATMNYLVKYCQVKRVVILTPKSVLKQWQDELYEHFGINAWMYDSNSKAYYDCNNKYIPIGTGNPLGKRAPEIVLMSAQYARGSGKNGDLFSKKDTILPDLLVVDEAHSARISKSLSGTMKKTRMYSMLENISRRIPHLILATATPMQKEANEYHAILKLLGLPKVWQKTRNYQTSLNLIGKKEIPDISDAASAAILLCHTVAEMSPALKRLSDEEKEILAELLALDKTSDKFELGSYVQKKWLTIRNIFIRLHPAHLLTVRNTRKSLAKVGYKFPARNLHEVSIEDSLPVQLFYHNVDQYLSNDCFLVEQELYPDRKISIGFVRVSYQQRVASSLHSCKKSLERRFEKLSMLKKKLDDNLSQKSLVAEEFEIQSIADDFDLDDLLEMDCDELEGNEAPVVDIKALRRAVGIETTALSSLLHGAEVLLNACGDMKVCESICLAIECLNRGDKVLLFSRYTDTIDALVNEFKRVGADCEFVYGIYTGGRSVIIDNNTETACDKNDIKRNLFSGHMKLVFCSDAASEGLNLQAARVLINVDVPWTPSRLEQRIGRIARLGQVAAEVEVYNVWYPYSIEAKMYHRIQKRLEEANLAIGEFPEIVATSIRNAILDGTEADTTDVEQLKEIRNSFQISVLEELWANEEQCAISETIRKNLIKICEDTFPLRCELREGLIKQFEMPDGKTIDLSCESGMKESISLKSAPWNFVDFMTSQFEVQKNSAGIPTAFMLSNTPVSIPVKHEAVIRSILGCKLKNEDYLFGWPAQLPNFTDLDLRFSIDCNLNPAPCNWIENIE